MGHVGQLCEPSERPIWRTWIGLPKTKLEFEPAFGARLDEPLELVQIC
jgi:hypothetical protein